MVYWDQSQTPGGHYTPPSIFHFVTLCFWAMNLFFLNPCIRMSRGHCEDLVYISFHFETRTMGSSLLHLSPSALMQCWVGLGQLVIMCCRIEVCFGVFCGFFGGIT